MNEPPNHAYTREQERSGFFLRACLLAFFALMWAYPVSELWQNLYYVSQADAELVVEGCVESMGRRSMQAVIEYQGEPYTVTRRGYHFTAAMHERARLDKRVQVYVNPSAPEESVMSLGVPPSAWVVYGLLSLIWLALAGASACQWWRWLQAR